MTNPTTLNSRLLRINVGFLLKQGAGYCREIIFDQSGTVRAEDTLISDLQGRLRLTRTPQGVLAQGRLHAFTSIECVRCLSPFSLPYEFEISELFIPAEIIAIQALDVPEANIISEGGFIDLTSIVREETILAIPIQALCSPTCKGLCSQCGQNLNEGTCDCHADRIDPRLASLRTLLEELDE